MFTFKACCKINLGLLVTERRPDGYHNLQTVFYPVPLSDEISVEEARKDSLTMSGIPMTIWCFVLCVYFVPKDLTSRLCISICTRTSPTELVWEAEAAMQPAS